MEIVFLIIISAIVYAYFFWRKFNEKEYLYFTYIGLGILAVHLFAYFMNNLYKPFYPAVFLNGIFLIGIDIITICIALIIIINKNKVSFKKNINFKNYYRTINGIPQLISINPYFHKFSEKNKYPYCLVIHIKISQKNKKGLPDNRKEISGLDKSEDIIHNKINSICNYYFVGRITHNGFRYLYYYIDKKIDEKEAFEKIGLGVENFKTFYTSLKEDKNWEILNVFNPLLSQKYLAENSDSVQKEKAKIAREKRKSQGRDCKDNQGKGKCKQQRHNRGIKNIRSHNYKILG